MGSDDFLITGNTSSLSGLLAQNDPPKSGHAQAKVIDSFNRRLALLKKAAGTPQHNQMTRDHVGTIRLQIEAIEMFINSRHDSRTAARLLRDLLKPYLTHGPLDGGDSQLRRWLESAFQKDPSLRVRAFLILSELATRSQQRHELALAYQHIKSAPENSGIPYHLQAKRWLFEAQFRLQNLSPVLTEGQQKTELDAIALLLTKAEDNLQWATHLRTEWAHVRADLEYRNGLLMAAQNQKGLAARAFESASRWYDEALRRSKEGTATEYDQGDRRHNLRLGKLRVLSALLRREAFERAFARDVTAMPPALKSLAWFEKAKLYFELGADSGQVNETWIETARQSAVSAADGLSAAGPDYRSSLLEARFIEGESNMILGHRGAAKTAFSIVANQTDKTRRPDMWVRAQLNIAQIDLIEKRFSEARKRIDQAIAFLKTGEGKKVDDHWMQVALLRRAESSLWQDMSKLTWKQRQVHYARIQKELFAIDIKKFDPHTLQAEYIHQLAITYEGWSWSFYEMPRMETAKHYMAKARGLYKDAIREAEASRFGYDRKIRINELKLKLKEIDEYMREIRPPVPPSPQASPSR